MGSSILEHFSMLEDPRIERGKEHQLLDIVVLAICAVVSGAEGWEGNKRPRRKQRGIRIVPAGSHCAVCCTHCPAF